MVSADPIVVVPYDEAWPSLYEEEWARIERAIGPWAESVEHVGSTAVPGLAAKPVIDIMVGVRSLEDSPTLVERLVGIGYEYVPEFEQVLPFRRYFRRMREGRRTHQIHLVERSNTVWWDRHLLFRDYLRAHPEVADEYARLKHRLSDRFGEDREGVHGCQDGFHRGGRSPGAGERAKLTAEESALSRRCSISVSKSYAFTDTVER